MDTVAAIATPNTTGSVSMIRVSGTQALEIAAKIFKPASGRNVGNMRGYTAAYGAIYDGGEKLDDGVLLVFKAPRSYTGEDVAEITCHGGIYVTRRVLGACVNAGARLAEAGEFSKRALLNGKISLTQAEAIADIIGSRNARFLSAASAQKDGALFGKIEEITGEILSVSAGIAAWIDYPDEGLEDNAFDTAGYSSRFTEIRERLNRLLSTFEIGQILREGAVTAIVGKPNAGKSTLMNLLTGKNRSIVTETAGTTRDIVEETVNTGDVVLRLCDCAGIRETGDDVEKIGIENMLGLIGEADLIIAVFDNSKPLEKEDFDLIGKVQEKTALCVINKADLERKIDRVYLERVFGAGATLEICAKDENALEQLLPVINKIAGAENYDLSAGFIANERQRNCAVEALSALEQANADLEKGAAPDIIGFLLESALDSLYRLSGKTAGEEIIGEVFKNFCVGK